MENLKDELNDLLTMLVKLNAQVANYVHEWKWGDSDAHLSFEELDLIDTTLQDICFNLEKIVADIKDD